MKLDEAIKSGQQKYQMAKELEIKKRKLRPLTKNGFWQEFDNAYTRYGHGRPLEPNKETINKLSGLINILKKNGMETNQDAYEFIDFLFNNWPSRAKTLKNKEYILDVKPNLKDIANCRDYFLAEYFKEEQDTHFECGENLLDLLT